MAFVGPLNYPENPVSMCEAWKQDARISISLANRGFLESEYQWLVSAGLSHHWAGFNTENFRML